MLNRVINLNTACDLAAQAAVLAMSTAGLPGAVVTGIAVRLLACTLLGRLLEMGIQSLQTAVALRNPKVAETLDTVSMLAALVVRGWLVARLFPSSEVVTFRGFERVRVMDIVENGGTKVIFEYRPIQWTRNVLQWVAGVQVAGLAAQSVGNWLSKRVAALAAFLRGHAQGEQGLRDAQSV